MQWRRTTIESGALSTHTQLHICLILLTTLASEQVGKKQIHKRLPAKRRPPRSAIRTRTHTALTSKILPYSTIIPSPRNGPLTLNNLQAGGFLKVITTGVYHWWRRAGGENPSPPKKKPSFDFGKLPAINAIPSPLTQSFSSLVSRVNVPPSSQQPAVSSGGRLAEGELGGCYAG